MSRGVMLRDGMLGICSFNNASALSGCMGKDASFGFKTNRVLRWV